MVVSSSSRCLAVTDPAFERTVMRVVLVGARLAVAGYCLHASAPQVLLVGGIWRQLAGKHRV